MTGDGKPPRRQELRTGGEVGLIQALGGREQSRAPYRETRRSGGRKWRSFWSEDFYFFLCSRK